ncbi:head-tail connector protein, partial [Sphingomonas sp. NPDC049708]|uniref:head-tail connector protein n=1 Tax=Sphingomonas sp. NPDC049708 TaxID=3390681 RepID=UPI003D0722C6
HSVSWPSVRSERESVRIRYEAGYPDTVGDTPKSTVPAPVVAAIKLMIGDLFENRASVAPGARPKIDMSTTVERLLMPFKVWRV